MGPPPVVSGISPREGPPGTKITIRGENLGISPQDLVGVFINGCDCLLISEWKTDRKIVALAPAKTGKARLRFELHPSVHNFFLNIFGVSGIIADHATSFYKPSFYQI